MWTLRELAGLARATGTLWWRRLPLLLVWCALGWAARMAGTTISVQLGGEHRAAATVVFVLGATAQVLTTIAMIWTLKPDLLAPRRIASGTAPLLDEAAVPASVSRHERLVEVLGLSVGPFLAVYAVWSVIDQWVADLFIWNIAFNPLGSADDSWSVSTDGSQLPLYLAIGLVAFVLKLGYGLLVKTQRQPLVRLPLVFLEGLWTFCLFFITLMGIDRFTAWFMRRAIYLGAMNGWQGFLDWLPDIRLPFDLSLPEALRALTIWTTEALFPAVWHGFCLPLVWLALTATVFGWRDFHVRDLLRGKWRRHVQRLNPTSTAGQALLNGIGILGADLRDKYLPVAHALRLIWQAGPRILGVFIVGYAALESLRHLISAAVMTIFGPSEQVAFVRFMPFSQLPAELIIQPLLVCLLVATFDRGLLATIGAPATEQGRVQLPEQAGV